MGFLRRARRLVALAVCGLVLLPLPGGSVDLPEQFKDWKILDPLGKESTSACIGDPKTPVCAAETAHFCTSSGNASFCDSVNYDFAYFHPGLKVSQEHKLVYELYREIARRPVVAGEKIVTYRNWYDYVGKRGDLALHFDHWLCLPDRDCLRAQPKYGGDPDWGVQCRTFSGCGGPAGLTVILRREGLRWSVVRFIYDSSIQGDFWKRK